MVVDNTVSLHRQEVEDQSNVTHPGFLRHSRGQHQVAVAGQRADTVDPARC